MTWVIKQCHMLLFLEVTNEYLPWETLLDMLSLVPFLPPSSRAACLIQIGILFTLSFFPKVKSHNLLCFRSQSRGTLTPYITNDFQINCLSLISLLNSELKQPMPILMVPKSPFRYLIDPLELTGPKGNSWFLFNAKLFLSQVTSINRNNVLIYRIPFLQLIKP